MKMSDAPAKAKRKQHKDVKLMGLEYYEKFHQETFKE